MSALQTEEAFRTGIQERLDNLEQTVSGTASEKSSSLKRKTIALGPLDSPSQTLSTPAQIESRDGDQDAPDVLFIVTSKMCSKVIENQKGKKEEERARTPLDRRHALIVVSGAEPCAQGGRGTAYIEEPASKSPCAVIAKDSVPKGQESCRSPGQEAFLYAARRLEPCVDSQGRKPGPEADKAR